MEYFMETYVLGGGILLFTIVTILVGLRFALAYFFPRETK